MPNYIALGTTREAHATHRELGEMTVTPKRSNDFKGDESKERARRREITNEAKELADKMTDKGDAVSFRDPKDDGE